VYPPQDSIALQPTLLAPVRSATLLLPLVNLLGRWDLLSHAVRVWDVVGEDQVLKGEYKVISGKMCVTFFVFFLSFLRGSSCAFEIFFLE
jgi:hypothetical protein